MASRNIVIKNNTRCFKLHCSAIVFGLLVLGSLYFGWLDLFSKDPTFTTSRIFVHGFCSWFNPLLSKLIPYFRPKRLKKHALWRGTSLYSLYKGLPPPPTPLPGRKTRCILGVSVLTQARLRLVPSRYLSAFWGWEKIGDEDEARASQARLNLIPNLLSTPQKTFK